MGFRLTFFHVAGVENSLADGLSRRFQEMSQTERQSWIPQIEERDDFLFAIRPASNCVPSEPVSQSTDVTATHTDGKLSHSKIKCVRFKRQLYCMYCCIFGQYR